MNDREKYEELLSATRHFFWILESGDWCDITEAKKKLKKLVEKPDGKTPLQELKDSL